MFSLESYDEARKGISVPLSIGDGKQTLTFSENEYVITCTTKKGSLSKLGIIKICESNSSYVSRAVTKSFIYSYIFGRVKRDVDRKHIDRIIRK